MKGHIRSFGEFANRAIDISAKEFSSNESFPRLSSLPGPLHKGTCFVHLIDELVDEASYWFLGAT